MKLPAAVREPYEDEEGSERRGESTGKVDVDASWMDSVMQAGGAAAATLAAAAAAAAASLAAAAATEESPEREVRARADTLEV